MSYDLLMQVALVQLALVLLMLTGLLMARIARSVFTSVYDREVEVGEDTIARWLAGELCDENARARLAKVGDDAFAAIVGAYAGRVEGGRWEDIVGMLRTTPWFSRVRSHAGSRFWWRRLDAARALSLVALESDLEHAKALLRDPHHGVRLAAIRILRRVPEPDLLRELFTASIEASPVLRRYIFDVLQVHDRAVVDTVLSTLGGTAGPRATCVALEYVTETADPIYMDEVLQLTSVRSAEIRAAAVRAASEFPHGRSTQALMLRLDDECSVVRRNVCESLGRIASVAATGGLEGRLADVDREVRLAAGVALRRIGVPGVRVLREQLQRDDEASDQSLVRYILGLEPDAIDQIGPTVRGL